MAARLLPHSQQQNQKCWAWGIKFEFSTINPFMSGGGGSHALNLVGTSQTTYLTADHFGSGSLLINRAGSAPINESYSAYGYRRSSNWAGPLAANSADYTTITSTTRRGYTDAFHEMLDNVGLIHLNGRVYDPVIGRFLSADPKMDGLGMPGGPNAYAYVRNSPLTLIDPFGLEANVDGDVKPVDGDDYHVGADFGGFFGDGAGGNPDGPSPAGGTHRTRDGYVIWGGAAQQFLLKWQSAATQAWLASLINWNTEPDYHGLGKAPDPTMALSQPKGPGLASPQTTACHQVTFADDTAMRRAQAQGEDVALKTRRGVVLTPRKPGSIPSNRPGVVYMAASLVAWLGTFLIVLIRAA
jgi:RHS repeat-associated protein